MLRLEDLIQRDVVAVSPDLTLRELLDVFTQREVSGAPVVSGRKVIGVISMTDIFDFREDAAGAPIGSSAPIDDLESAPRRRRGAAASEFFSELWEAAESGAVEWMKTTRDREWDLLDQYTVADAMTRNVVSQPSSATVKKAARYMLDAGIHRVLIIDDGELQGIVTTTDIVRAVAEGKLRS